MFIDNKCPHIPKAVNFNKIKKCVNKVGISLECSICKKCKNNSSKLNEKVYIQKLKAFFLFNVISKVNIYKTSGMCNKFSCTDLLTMWISRLWKRRMWSCIGTL